MKKIINRLLFLLVSSFTLSIFGLSLLKINKEINAVVKLNSVANNNIDILLDKNSVKFNENLQNKTIFYNNFEYTILSNKEYLDDNNVYEVSVLIDKNFNAQFGDIYNVKIEMETIDMLFYILNNII